MFFIFINTLKASSWFSNCWTDLKASSSFRIETWYQVQWYQHGECWGYKYCYVCVSWWQHHDTNRSVTVTPHHSWSSYSIFLTHSIYIYKAQRVFVCSNTISVSNTVFELLVEPWTPISSASPPIISITAMNQDKSENYTSQKLDWLNNFPMACPSDPLPRCHDSLVVDCS